jgi:hypothetical protein
MNETYMVRDPMDTDPVDPLTVLERLPDLADLTLLLVAGAGDHAVAEHALLYCRNARVRALVDIAVAEGAVELGDTDVNVMGEADRLVGSAAQLRCYRRRSGENRQ